MAFNKVGLWLIILTMMIGCGKNPLSFEALGDIMVASKQEDNTTQLYTIQPDGSNLIQITQGEHSYVAHRWSPDGRRVVVMSDKDRLTRETLAVHVMDANGSNMRLLSRPGRSSVWSPDGNRIALSKGDGYNPSDVIVLNVDGSNEKNLTNSRFSDVVHDWSPDGTRLLIGSNDQEDNSHGDFELYIIDLTGQRLTRLTDNDVLDTGSRWSPDGRTIAYLSFDLTQGKQAIFLMNEDGSDNRPVQIAPSGIFINGLTWSPDGARIAFISEENLYTVNIDGTELVTIVSGMSIRSIDWRR